jgi:hypothetical protein
MSDTAYALPEPPLTPYGPEAAERVPARPDTTEEQPHARNAASAWSPPQRAESDRVYTSPLGVSIDEYGQFVVQDVIGAVYGVGATAPEAVADFNAVLTKHMMFLRSHHDEVHADLQRQLLVLESLFPGP